MKNEIKWLLETYIECLGKKSSQGYGMIDRWEVEEIESDNSFMFESGNISKVIPERLLTNNLHKFENIKLDLNGMKLCTFQFPYWDISKQEKCFVPKTIFNNEKEFNDYTNLKY